MIRRVCAEELGLCADIIRKSFATVADEFGFTPQNAPRFTAFAVEEALLLRQMTEEKRELYGCFVDSVLVGFFALSYARNNECELNNLCVLPEYRHLGIGRRLIDRAFSEARAQGCTAMKIGIVEENAILRKWYEAQGFVHTGTQRFEHLPFTVGYMEKKLQ